MRQRATNVAAGMSDPISMRDTLHRFSMAPDVLARERRSLPGTPRARLEILLREIDETVLARNIKFYSNRIHFASLTVSNRRLVAFRRPKDKDTRSRPEKPSAQDFAACLLEISKRATGFTTEAVRQQDTGASPEAGCSIAALRAELGLNGGAHSTARLAQLLQESVLAQVTWVGDFQKSVCTGDETWREFLETFAKAALDKTAGTQSAFSNGEDPTGFALPISKRYVLVFACDAHAGVAAVTPKEQGLKILNNWQMTASAGN